MLHGAVRIVPFCDGSGVGWSLSWWGSGVLPSRLREVGQYWSLHFSSTLGTHHAKEMDLSLFDSLYGMYMFMYMYSVLPYFTAEAPTSNKRPPPILAKKSCVGLIALELAPTVNYWFKG